VINAISTTIPIFVLIILGVLSRQWKVVRAESLPDLKSLVIHLALPLVVFRVFGTMRYEPQFLLIMAIMFAGCTLVFFLAKWITQRNTHLPPFSYFLMAGFEAGMLGYAVFGSAYGAENISRFAVIDLGHVIFIFFILVTGLENINQNKRSFGDQLLKFIKTPVIIGIFAGLLFNLTGLYRIMQANDLSASVLSGLDTMSHITLPVVAFIIGFELRFNREVFSRSLLTALVRYAIWLVFALLVNKFVLINLLNLDTSYQAALFVMATLPAPYIIPIYFKSGDQSDRDYILNTLTIGTVLFLIGLVVIKTIYP